MENQKKKGSDIYAVIGGNISMFRKKEGISLEQLARRSGISTSFLSNIEKGTRKPTLYTLENISRGLKIGMNSLFLTRENEKYMPEDSRVTFELMKLISGLDIKDKEKIKQVISVLFGPG